MRRDASVVTGVKAALELSATRLHASTFAETLQWYIEDPAHRRYRSAVQYRPTMTPASYSETHYVLPRRLTTTYVSCVDVRGTGDARHHRWYRSSIEVQPATINDGFCWSQALVVGLPFGRASSGFASGNDEDRDESL